jgi:phosphoglucomutase
MPNPLETRSVATVPGENSISPSAGQPAPKGVLLNVARLERDYFERRPDLNDSNQLVSFGTSGHRGSPVHGTFTEAHILAIQADGVTPTPVISRAILVSNRDRTEHLADGIVITPSHNPPEDGGFKYNPPNGGQTHLNAIVSEAQAMLNNAFTSSGSKQ